MSRVLLLVWLVVVLALPAVAAAQSNPFGPLPPPDLPPPAPTPEPVQVDDGRFSTTTLLLIGGAVIVVFVGIGWYITRDARAHLTEDDRRSLALENQNATDEQRKRQSEAARKKARARAKAQRQARKKQRAR